MSPDSASSPGSSGTATNNILTAIDPTYNREKTDTIPPYHAPSPPISRDPSLTLDMPRRMPTGKVKVHN